MDDMQLAKEEKILLELGDEQPARQIVEHISLAVRYFYKNDIRSSLEHFYSAEKLSRHTIVQQADLSVSFDLFIALCREYGRTVYELGDDYTKDAESIYLFGQKMLEQEPNAYFFEKGSLAYYLGILYMEHKTFSKAYEQFDAAANFLIKFGPAEDEMKKTCQTLAYSNYYNLALCSHELLKFDTEEASWIQAAKIQYALAEPDHIEFLNTLLQLTSLYLHLHQIQKADQVLKECGKIMQLLDHISADVYYLYRYYESAVYEWNSESKKALAVIDSCLSEREKLPMMPAQQCNFLILKHTILLNLKQTEQCLAVIDEILNLFYAHADESENPTHLDAKELYHLRAVTYDEMENSKLSLHNFRLSLQEYEKENDRNTFWEILFLTDYTLALMNSGLYSDARKAGERCIAIIDELEVDTEQYNSLYVSVYINLGIICLRQIQLDPAETYLYKALHLCRKTASEKKHLKDEILALVGLSWLYHSQHLFDRAQFYADSAAELIAKDTQNNYVRQQIELYEIYASILFQSGNMENSIQLIDKAIAKAENTHLLLCNCYCQKGDILYDTDPEQAQQQYLNALDIIRSMDLEKTESYLMIILNLLDAQKIPDQTYLDEAKVLLEEKGFPGGYFKLSAYIRLISCCIRIQNLEDAFAYAAKAVVTYSQTMEEAVAHKNTTAILDHKLLMQKVFNLLFYLLSWSDEDMINQFPLIDFFMFYKIGDYYLLRLINQAFPTTADQDQCYRKVQLQLNHMQYLSKYLQQTDSSQTDTLLSEKYDQLYWAEKDPFKKNIPDIVIEEKYMDFWVIDYYFPTGSFDEDSPVCPFAIIWQPKKLDKKQYVKLSKAAPIHKSIARFQKALLSDSSTFDQEEELYQLLIQPLIRREPRIGTAKDFIICPESEVTTIPFDVLLGTDCRILYAPFPDYVFAASMPAAKCAAVCGSPVLTEQNAFGVSPLRDSDRECGYAASALQQAGYQTHLFYGAGPLPFEKQALLDSLNENHYSVIHISTHGFYMEQQVPSFYTSDCSAQNDPMHRCGLILNDCICDGQYNVTNSVLWGDDILDTDLNGTQLAILSCCVSGIGHMESGDWLLGLQRAFFTAGVENLIVSLWNVDENATAMLMQYFYECLSAGQPADLALQQAKGCLRKYRNGIYSTPYYWAGFIYIGKICSIVSAS